MAAVRTATVTWTGDLPSGEGTVSAGSGVFTDLPVSWPSRIGEANGPTAPEELLAAAHAACFAMAFSAQLGRNGTPPRELHVEAEVTFDKVGDAWGVISSRLIVVGEVDGIDDARFDELADAAKDGCPISQALNENVAISVEPTLEH
ncbi:MAG TPA: OsmC family peroxiredoxin [Candidatus Limnocylindria bacterium]